MFPLGEKSPQKFVLLENIEKEFFINTYQNVFMII
jgi:hypothetical protein